MDMSFEKMRLSIVKQVRFRREGVFLVPPKLVIDDVNYQNIFRKYAKEFGKELLAARKAERKED
jgi:hypothetical protein